MRLLCADHYPDHGSLCSFRRENRALLAKSFRQVLETAARIRVLREGEVTLALNGTKILANASSVSLQAACGGGRHAGLLPRPRSPPLRITPVIA